LGAHNISTENEHGRIRKNVKKIIVHKDWNPKAISYDHDIAIIQLDSPVEFDQFIRPICLLSEKNREIFNSGNVTGWGEIDDDHTLADVARTSEFEIVEKSQCHDTNRKNSSIFWPESFCAKSDNAGVCKLDSGSGLVVKIGNRFYLKGLVSSSLVTLCSDIYVAIYTDLQKYYNFIKVSFFSQS
jgi:secreted trypsin-like serine protease